MLILFDFLCYVNVLAKISSSAQIPPTLILLGNQSTIDVFCNKHLLKDVHRTNQSMSIHCNAGVKVTSKIGTLPGYGKVWYHSNGIANILSLSRVRQNGLTVTYDDKDNCFIITKLDGQKLTFDQSDGGLYYLDAAKNET
jgi:hypothetical protein